MKWKPKNDTCGVPGKGYIQSQDFSEEDEKNLIARAKNRKVDVHTFMLNAGFVPVNAQLELEVDTRAFEKRTRRGRNEINANAEPRKRGKSKA